MTVIADDSGAISLGGIMGGESTGCTAETVDVVLEVALFDPIRTALTGRRLGIESDARTRFERGVDPAMVLPGMEYATRLILELCGGQASAPIVAGCRARAARRVPVPDQPARAACRDRAGRCRRSTGQLKRARLRGRAGDGPEAVQVTPPSWRHDVTHGGGRGRGAGAATRLRPRAADAGAAHRGGRPSGAQPRAAAALDRAPRAGRARPGRGGHLVVHRAGARAPASATTGCACAIRSTPSCRSCGRACCPTW